MGEANSSANRDRSDLNEEAREIVDRYYEEMGYLGKGDKSKLQLPWTKDFHEQWVATGNTTSVNNDMLHTASMLSIVSRALFQTRFTSLENNTEIPVIHTLSIQKSGSGKSPALKYAGQLARAAGFDYRSQTTLTEAGLIGGVRGDEVVDGIAASKEVIGFDESRTLFKLARNEGKGTFGEMLNQVLDFRHIYKDLATGKIDYDPKPVFIGISYPPSDMDLAYFMESGLLSRFFILYRSFGLEDYRQVAGKLMEGFMGSEAQKNQENRLPEDLIDYVRDTLRMDLEYLQYNTALLNPETTSS